MTSKIEYKDIFLIKTSSVIDRPTQSSPCRRFIREKKYGKTKTLKLKLHLHHAAVPKRATLTVSAHDAAGDSKVTRRKIKLK